MSRSAWNPCCVSWPRPWLYLSKTTSCRFIVVGQLRCYIGCCHIIILTRLFWIFETFRSWTSKRLPKYLAPNQNYIESGSVNRSCLFLPVVLTPTSPLCYYYCLYYSLFCISAHAQVWPGHHMKRLGELNITFYCIILKVWQRNTLGIVEIVSQINIFWLKWWFFLKN